MSQSLCKIYTHIVFHIKSTSSKIRQNDLTQLHSYIGGIINKMGGQSLCVGGVEDHVHVLCTLPKNESPCHLVEEIKKNSSHWIKTLGPYYEKFAWQGGYAIFSVSQSIVDRTTGYIRDQAKHHVRHTFRDEYLALLKIYQISFDEKYVFTD